MIQVEESCEQPVVTASWETLRQRIHAHSCPLERPRPFKDAQARTVYGSPNSHGSRRFVSWWAWPRKKG